MRLLALQRLLPLQRAGGSDGERRRQQQILDQNASANKRKGSPCQQDSDGYSQAAKIMRCSIHDLPEDIWSHIHSLMPLRDAARAACVSRAFLSSWRCRPNLTLNIYTLAPKMLVSEMSCSDKIDCILRNHSGCLKALILELDYLFISQNHLDSWLHIAVKPGIEELTLVPSRFYCKYNVPCSLLSDGVRNSIRCLKIGLCTFRPTAELGPLRRLTSLDLHTVRITGDELECLLSNALSLEQLFLTNCNEITHLRIPCALQQLACLVINGWRRLQVIENKAPKLSSFCFSGQIPLASLGETLHMKHLTLYRSNVVYHARAELPCIMPNLETLVLTSREEELSTPMLRSKFLYLKHLSIDLISGLRSSSSYDYLSLVSFLYASPSLETLKLNVAQHRMKHESAVGGSSHLRQIPEHHHCCLKGVNITGFSCAKGLVELVCCILRNAVSLESMTLDTISGRRCSGNDHTLCSPKSARILKEVSRAVTAIRECIEDKVPSTVQLNVLEPCIRC